MDPLAFESIGDNCEVGFVQRAFGAEPGGLLRWATTPPRALIKVLREDFRDLYDFDRLEPFTPGMVRDQRYNIAFHSLMTSTNRVFDQTEGERRAIHAREKAKVDYLVDKLRQRMADGRVLFVYKRNTRIEDQLVAEIGAEIARRGPGQLLYVTDNAPRLAVGELRHMRKNIHIGRMTRFAPYSQANALDLEGWQSLLRNALQTIPLPAPAPTG